MIHSIDISILCLTYNHKKYIKECLNGFLIQKTNLNCEIIIHDDGSDDGTVAILQNYKNLYPDRIQLILNQKEVHTSIHSFHHILSRFKPKGKYIAFCEGDDYWTDENKLQVQFDFLESNPSYSFCCHRYHKLINGKLTKEIAHDFYKDSDLEITQELFFKTWLTQPLTAVLRSEFWDVILEESSSYHFFRDVHLFYALLQKGKGISLNGFMGVYRVHNKGHKSGKSTVENLLIAYEIWKELLEDHPHDDYLRKQYLLVVRRIMLYSSTRKKLKLYLENFKLSAKDLRSLIHIHLYLIKHAPPPIT